MLRANVCVCVSRCPQLVLYGSASRVTCSSTVSPPLCWSLHFCSGFLLPLNPLSGLKRLSDAVFHNLVFIYIWNASLLNKLFAHWNKYMWRVKARQAARKNAQLVCVDVCPISMSAFIDDTFFHGYFHACIWDVHMFLYVHSYIFCKLSGNNEKYLSNGPKAQGDAFKCLAQSDQWSKTQSQCKKKYDSLIMIHLLIS